MRNYGMAYAAHNAVFLCAACGAEGMVRISVTRSPENSIRRQRNVIAAQWAWIGSESRAKLLVKRLRRDWAARYVIGEGYRFDYATEGAAFRDELNRSFLEVVGGRAQWEKLGPDGLRVLRGANKGRTSKTA